MKEHKGILWSILAICAIGFLITGYMGLTADKPVNQIIEIPEITQYNDTALQSAIVSIQDKLDEEDNWKAEAKSLALEELEDDEYEELFDWMVANLISIYREEDISSVEIDDTDFFNLDEEEKDADIDFELIVKYEDTNGDDKKEYITASAEILDNDVEELDFVFT